MSVITVRTDCTRSDLSLDRRRYDPDAVSYRLD